MTPRNDHDEGAARRLSDLLGLSVEFSDGSHAGFVNDIRLAATGRVHGMSAELATDGLIVSRREHASLLGYDRKAEQGPWLVRVVMRWVYRNGGLVPWTSVGEVDLQRGVVRLTVASLEPLDAP